MEHKPLRPVVDVAAAEVLSHPVRLRLLRFLDHADRTVAELAARAGEDHIDVAAHLAALEAVGHVQRAGERWGTSVRWFVPNDTWAQLREESRQAQVDEAMEMMAEQIAAATVSGAFRRDDAVLAWMGPTYDEQGFAEASALMERMIVELDRVRVESAERLRRANGNGKRVQALAITLLFEADPAALDGSDG